MDFLAFDWLLFRLDLADVSDTKFLGPIPVIGNWYFQSTVWKDENENEPGLVL